MYQFHSDFTSPDDENTPLWRYMDFTKLVALLDRRSLFFPRLSTLSDAYEGYVSKPTILELENYERQLIATGTLTPLSQVSEQFKGFFNKSRNDLFVSSWHENEHESAAMWRLYSTTGNGVAIRSTFKRLRDSFEASLPTVFIGRVQYIDFRSEVIPLHSVFAPALRKRKSFEHERELRAVVWSREHDFSKASVNVTESGLYVPVNLDSLIERIFLEPGMPQWLHELITSVLEKFGVGKKDVVKSSLDDEPPLY